VSYRTEPRSDSEHALVKSIEAALQRGFRRGARLSLSIDAVPPA
jgi:hypothetical protein